MGESTCSIEGCERPVWARGWCSTHYNHWWSAQERVRPLCSIEGCERPICARSWCTVHYQRWRKHGDPLAGGPSNQPGPVGGLCSVKGCNKPHEARGWCDTHYSRWREHGSTDLPRRSTAYERFVAKVDASGGADVCHPWTASRNEKDYGHFYADGEYFKAPRWLLGYLRGKALGPDEWALHHCDNPPCCNPAHLYIGDCVQNVRDMVARGRGAMQSRTHCPHGHPYDEQNTRLYQGRRFCRMCHKLRGRTAPGQNK